jgi:hypothetical protein
LSQDEIKPEFKTIRISAPLYYKLIELSGLVSALIGVNISISQMADIIIGSTHQTVYPELVKVLNNPQLVQKNRKDFEDLSKYWYDLTKHIKIKE